MSNAPIRPNFNNLPEPLRARPQWVCWKYGRTNGNGKRAKLPINAQTGTAASTTDPATWTTFEKARAAYQRGGYTGIGYVLTQDDPFVFIDLDNVIRNGEMAPGTVATVKGFASYTERSVSGTGVHVIVEGTTPNRKNERGEVYSDRRFIAITGAIVCEQGTIQPRQTELDAWTAATFPPVEDRPLPTPTAPTGPVATDDNTLLDTIYNSKQGGRFAALMTGDTKGYKSHSEADAALCSMLAFWTDHDPAQIDRMFRQSGLMRPKWDRVADGTTQRTYGRLTVDNAIRRVTQGYRPRKNEGSRVNQICDTWRAHYADTHLHSATQRVLLATLRKFQDVDALTTYISSRNISDLTGLSHSAAMMHLRLLCPQTRAARLRRLQCDLNRVDAQLRAAGNATTPEEMLLTIRPQERTAILAKCGDQGEGAIMAEVMIFLTNRRDRATNEMRFYATHPALDILDVTETHAGSALATVYTLRTPPPTLQFLSTERMITVGGGAVHSDHDLCGKKLQSSFATLAFIEGQMQDDAFVVVPPARRDPRLRLEPDPVKRKRLAALLAPDAKLQPFGLSTPVVFAHLTAHPGATVADLVTATGLGERTIRTVLKNTGPALVEGGHLPLVESQKQGRKYGYFLADDWRERLDSLRSDLATDGVIAARAVFHAGERIQRIDKFLAQGMRDHRRPLDDATRARYQAIKAAAQQLQARILGREVPTATVQPDALALSDALVTVEKAIVEALAPALTRPLPPLTVTKKAPAPPPALVRHWLGHPADAVFGHSERLT